MLTRRVLRIKAMQAAYAFFKGDETDLPKGENALLASINKIHELLINHLSILAEVNDFAINHIEQSKHKRLPTPEDLNPNTKFVDNKLLLQLQQNDDFKKYRELYSINWSDEPDLIKNFYFDLKKSSEFQFYLAEPDIYKADKEIVIHLYKSIIAESEVLEDILESKNVHWSHDYDLVRMLMDRLLGRFKKSADSSLSLSLNFNNNEDDKQFLLDLYRKTVLKTDQYLDDISESAKNWELDRIAFMDLLIIRMALCEATEFESIPLKVTMNEYIELSKLYSTSKSRVFVNGILDKLFKKYKTDNKIKKIGRGLV